MALTKSNQHGASYQWGVHETEDAPSGITGFTPHSAEITFEPEVKTTSKDGEGHADGIVLSKPAKRKASGTITGYVTDSFDPATLAEHFTWDSGIGSRKWFIGPISHPRPAGEYHEVTISIESFAGIS